MAKITNDGLTRSGTRMASLGVKWLKQTVTCKHCF